jgi:Fe-S-cluster containining protein
MVEKIIHDKKLYALIIKKYHSKKNGINFFTPNYFPQQLGFMKHDKNKLIKPHYHKKRLTKILITTEIILIIKGLLRVDFYNPRLPCIFYNTKVRACSMYDIRPKTCQEYECEYLIQNT